MVGLDFEGLGQVGRYEMVDRLYELEHKAKSRRKHKGIRIKTLQVYEETPQETFSRSRGHYIQAIGLTRHGVYSVSFWPVVLRG